MFYILAMKLAQNKIVFDMTGQTVLQSSKANWCHKNLENKYLMFFVEQLNKPGNI